MAFICKKCKKAFRKDMTNYEESDEYCPHCDNHYVIEAKTPAPVLGVEGEDARVDARMLKDDRVKPVHHRSLFSELDDDDFLDRLG
ncbi:CHY zinc finger domain-containing protein [Coprinopsis cinerea AmutBmut pab1-1]|nr:CHY zinc finger domain-containing protein [Coprinopsis cinerea AmutBmut pab1-1]